MKSTPSSACAGVTVAAVMAATIPNANSELRMESSKRYDGRFDDAISWLIHVVTGGVTRGARLGADEAVKDDLGHLVTAGVAQRDRDVVLRPRRIPGHRGLADGGDRAARLLQVLDLHAADDEP